MRMFAGIFAKVCLSALCAVVLLIVWFVLLIVMQSSFLSHALWLDGVVCCGAFLIFLLLIWKPFAAKIRKRIALGITAAVVVVFFGVSGVRAYQDSIPSVKTDISNLRSYEPFRENTLAKSLGEPSTLHLEGDLPRLDGATALYPVYSAFVRAVYPEADYIYFPDKTGGGNDTVICTNTVNAFYNLLNGAADIAFLADISDDQKQEADQRGIKLKFTPIGKEAFVFIINSRNPVSNLTTDNIRDIYSGKITNWSQVGGGSDAIRAYQRAKNSGSQTALEHIMGGAPLMTPPQQDVYDFMDGLYKAVADYKNYKNALGYSFRYYVINMMAGGGVKLLSINGVEPSARNIANGAYPFTGDFYAVTVEREPLTDAEKARADNADKLIQWILSPQGQSLVEKTGYVARG